MNRVQKLIKLEGILSDAFLAAKNAAFTAEDTPEDEYQVQLALADTQRLVRLAQKELEETKDYMTAEEIILLLSEAGCFTLYGEINTAKILQIQNKGVR